MKVSTRHSRLLKSGKATLIIAGVLVMTVSACSGGGTASTSSSIAGSTGSSANPSPVDQGNLPTSGEVKMFGQSRENPYFGLNEEGARTVAEKYGWTLSYAESSTQEEQDAAIAQALAQGDKPLGIILNPIAGQAAAASMQAIKAAGIPLVLLNQVPRPEQAALFDAYAGVNDVLSGETAAKLLVEGAKKAGIELGDGLIVNTVAGHTAAQDRVQGFTDVLAQESPSSKIIANTTSGGFLEAEGYTIASQMIPANKGKFNWVYGVNDALAVGAIQAAQESGLTAGKDVLFVGGTCMNPNTNAAVLDGELVGTAVQAPLIEGESAAYALAQILNNDGKVLDGELNLTPDSPPSIDTPASKWNFMPNPMVEGTQQSFDDTMIWGMSAQQLCNYS